MSPAKLTHCRKGHEFTSESTQWSTGKTGKPQRQCKTCNLEKLRLKYRHDKTYRERVKANSRITYERKLRMAKPTRIEVEDRVFDGNECGQIEAVYYRNPSEPNQPVEVAVRWNCGSWRSYDPAKLIPQEDGTWMIGTQ